MIDFFAPDPTGTGQMVLDHTIKLTNAFVASIEHNSDSLVLVQGYRYPCDGDDRVRLSAN